MKRFLCVLCIGMLLLSGCGGGDSAETTAAAEETTAAGETPAPAGDAYSFTAKGTAVVMNADAAPIVAALGDPKNYFESESCAFHGLDKQYDYGSFVIYTYPTDDKDFISGVDLMDDTVSTAEGISIGASADDVKAAYGEPTSATDAALNYVKGDCTLMFLITDGAVSSIQYIADTGI